MVALKTENARPGLASDFKEVPKAARRDHGYPCSLALNERIGSDSRAVGETRNGVGRDPVIFTHFPEALDDGPGGVVRRRQHLVDLSSSITFIDGKEIGEGSPDIDANCPGQLSLPPFDKLICCRFQPDPSRKSFHR